MTVREIINPNEKVYIKTTKDAIIELEQKILNSVFEIEEKLLGDYRLLCIGKNKFLSNYLINKEGIITNIKTGRKLKRILDHGRYKVGFYINKKSRLFNIHQLLMWSFKGYRQNLDIHHKDENKLNNNLNNLQYMTRSDHRRLHKLGDKNAAYGKIWVNNEKQQKLVYPNRIPKSFKKGRLK